MATEPTEPDYRPILTFEGVSYRVQTMTAPAYRLPDGRIVTVRGWREVIPNEADGILLAVEDAALG